MNNDTAAVVVTYNRKHLLAKCIESLLAQKAAACDIIVVDNASTDGTEEFISEVHPHIIYINTGKNLGGAGGFQTGVREAVRRGYAYIWMMDDDTIPESTALEKLLAADKELAGKWGFLSSAAYWTDGSICRANIQKKTIFRHVRKSSYQKPLEQIKMCSFVSLLVRSSVVKDVGLPIGEYFIWTDDYEYTGRISDRYPCYMVPGSKVVHAMKYHTRANLAADEGDRLGRYWYLYRNDVHCYRRYGIRGWAYLLLKDIYSVGNILLHSKENKRVKIGILCRGFAAGLRFSPEVEKWSCEGYAAR